MSEGLKREADSKESESSSMAASITSLILLFLLFMFLAKTNPGIAEYSSWVSHKIQDQSTSVLVDVGVDLLGKPIIESSTIVKDFIVFSIFTTEIGDQRSVTIGILGMFF